MKKRPQDFTGYRWAQLEAIRCVGQRTKSPFNYLWLCRCDCGKEIVLSTSHFNQQQSCGCARSRKFIDLTGKRFGRLTALRRLDRRGIEWYWLCACECGNQSEVAGVSLREGTTKSCGCLARDNLRTLATTHGFTGTRIHRIWKNMIQRCSNPKSRGYKDYGGRGIRVCKRWRKFENFLADMGEPPSPEHSIDRYPDNDGNYEPGNVRWATNVEQANNSRHNVWLEFNGERRTVRGWAKHLGVKEQKLHNRIRKGWPIERVLSGVAQ